MEDTENLHLPYIAAAQAQKHITHNEALKKIDALVQLIVIARDVAEPPASPPEGGRYIIAANGADAWAGKAHQIAAFQDGAWSYFIPQKGWRCWSEDEEAFLVFNGLDWQELSSGTSNTGGDAASVNPAALIGINTTADATNKLSVKSDAVLLSHDDTGSGSGDMQLKLNKADIANTASFLLQDDFSGRAEIGLSGDDDLHVKVSDDGSNWKEAIIIDKDTAEVQLPGTPLTKNSLFNLFQDAGRFAGSPEVTTITVGDYAAAPYLTPYNGTVFSGYAKYLHNNSTFGGSGSALNSEVAALVSSFKPLSVYRRYGPEFWVQKVTQGTGTAAPITVNGVTGYSAFSNRAAPLWVKSSWGVHVKAHSKSMCVLVDGSSNLYMNGVLQTSHFVLSPADGWKQLIYVGTADPQYDYEYRNRLFDIRIEQSGAMLMALCFLTPSQIPVQPGDIIGRVPGIGLWG